MKLFGEFDHCDSHDKTASVEVGCGGVQFISHDKRPWMYGECGIGMCLDCLIPRRLIRIDGIRRICAACGEIGEWRKYGREHFGICPACHPRLVQAAKQSAILRVL